MQYSLTPTSWQIKYGMRDGHGDCREGARNLAEWERARAGLRVRHVEQERAAHELKADAHEEQHRDNQRGDVRPDV